MANVDDASCEYSGCMDGTAFNYDESATIDDGSCIPFIEGCMNPDYLEYDPSANIKDGSCVDILVYGCTDETAVNFDQYANIDNGSCIPWIEGCIDEEYTEYDPDATVDDDSCLTLIVEGCTEETAANYDLNATTDDGSCTYYLLIVDYTHLGNSTYEFEVEVVSMVDYTILWSFGDDLYSNEEQVIHTYQLNGEYTITVTVSNGEMALVDEITIVVNIPGLGIDELEDQLLRENYFDLLGRPCLRPNNAAVYIRNREYESGKILRDKVSYKK